MTDSPARVSYGEMARLFVRFSLLAFGGPVAHIAIAEDELVTRRKWLTHEHYLDLIAATNLIPGPYSTRGHDPRGLYAARHPRRDPDRIRASSCRPSA